MVSIINSMDINLSKLQEIVKDRGAWCATAYGVSHSHLVTGNNTVAYSAVLVSVAEQSESAMCIRGSPLFHFPFPFKSPQSMPRVPWAVQCILIYFIHSINSVYVSIPISQLILSPTSPFIVHMFVLYICVSISALQIIFSIAFF